MVYVDRRSMVALGSLAAATGGLGPLSSMVAAAPVAAAEPSLASYLALLREAESLPSRTWSPHNQQIRMETWQQVMMNLSTAYFLFFQADPEHPEFSPVLNSVYTLQPNPDDNYVLARIRGDRRYRITGTRGSVHLLIMTLAENIIGMGMKGDSILPMKNHFENDLDTLGAVRPDGTIDIVLSADKPADPRAFWVKLDPDVKVVMFRQRSYAWGDELDARLAIECLDADGPRRRRSSAEIDGGLRGMMQLAVKQCEYFLDYQQSVKRNLVPNQVHVSNFAGDGMKMQTYWEALFDVRPDQALVIETDIPEVVKYWNVQINDELFNAVDYVYSQSSLNGAQAHLDSDGKFRAVLSLTDPGVANWLDPVGHGLGSMIGRWFRGGSQPIPTIKAVPLAEVRSHLPADTPNISREQRTALLAKRARGLQLRRRW